MAGYGSAFGGGRNRQFEVEVSFVQTRKVKVWAQDGLSAEEKATEIVEKWDGVKEVTDAQNLGEA